MNMMIKAALLTGCTLAAQIAQADNITVTGTLVQTACTVQTLPTVNLGDIRDVDMVSVGSNSTPIQFQLNLTNCPSTSTKVLATFAGTASNDSSLFKINSGTGAAAGLGITLLDRDHGGAQIKPAGTSQVTADASRNATFNLTAFATTDQATQVTGNINATIVVTFSYS